MNFPSFSEGLSLRLVEISLIVRRQGRFPFLFGRAFIEAFRLLSFRVHCPTVTFPFLFGRAFIEAEEAYRVIDARLAFPFLFGRAFIEAYDKSSP